MSLATTSTQIIPLLIVVIFLVILDSSTSDITPFIFEDVDFYNLTIFSILIIFSTLVQYAVLRIIGKRIRNLLSFKGSKLFHNINFIVPWILACSLFSILFEMYMSSGYHTVIVRFMLWTIYGTAILNMSILIFQFFMWFKSNKNYIIISYTVAIISIVINMTFSMVVLSSHTKLEPNIINWYYSPVTSISRVHSLIDTIYEITSIISFISIWLSSIFLLSHYAKKYGRIRFFVVIIAPLIYFLSLFSPSLTAIFAEFSINSPILARIIYTVLISAGKPIGGFLFGLIFWSASKNIGNKLLKEYVMIAGYGIMILFTSNQLIALTNLNYPPFGLVTVTFFSLASYIALLEFMLQPFVLLMIKN